MRIIKFSAKMLSTCSLEFVILLKFIFKMNMNKLKSYKIKTSFVNPPGQKARAKKTGIIIFKKYS